MSYKNSKKYLIHGMITFLIGLFMIIWGPIEFRGFPVSRSTGILVSLFGLGVIILEFFKKNKSN
jgi:hypothetical protein